MAGLRRSLGAIDVFGFSLSLIAPTLAMAFTVGLTVQSAGRAAPLAYLIGAIAVGLIGLSFVAFGRRIAHAGSVYAYIGSVFGRRCGFVIGWALLLMYIATGAGSIALVGNFAAASLGHVGIEEPHLWLLIAVVAAVLSVWLAAREMQLATRLMLVLEGISVLAILFLAIVILMHAPLSPLPFKPEPGVGWAGVGHGMVPAILAFAGFEGAATLGEESRDPRQSIPMAVMGTVIAAALFYVVVSYAQVIGYGLDQVEALGQANAPLDELSTRFISGGVAGFLDGAIATSALASAIGSLSAAARMLYALGRAGLARCLANIDAQRGTPVLSILTVGLVFVTGLLFWGAQSDAMSYSGNVVTIGTLSLVLVYISVAGVHAIEAFRDRRLVSSMVGWLGALLLLWPLWNSLSPAPPWPGNLWPYVVVAWLLLGAVIGLVRVPVTQSEIRSPGTGTL
jgi:amino acid transporter